MPDPISWAFSAPYFLLAFLFGYFLGAVPFGVVVTRIAGFGDVRSIGSGNIGATNVLRLGRKDLAVATLLLDALKGFSAVYIAALWGNDTAIIAGFGAFLGHLFPVWLRFCGGKGVATYLGTLAAFHWPSLLLFAFIWLAVATVSRYSSLSALTSASLIPLSLYGFGHIQIMELFLLLTIILIMTHRKNIQRLVNGTESKIGYK